MEIPKTLKITMDPETNKLIDAYSKTKEEYANRVNIILLAKQSQVNLAIQKMHQQFLLILQKKVLTIERKDDQIVGLNNALSQLKNEIYEAKKDIVQLTEQNKQLRRQHTNLINEVKQLTNVYNQQRNKRDIKKRELENTKQRLKMAIQSLTEAQRETKKFKQEYYHMKQSTQYLLKNQEQKLVSSYEKQLESLRLQKREKYTNYETRIKSQRRRLNEVQVTLKSLQETNEILRIKNEAGQLQTGVVFSSLGTQTDIQKQSLVYNYGVNVNIKCSKCEQLKRLLDRCSSSRLINEIDASQINKIQETSDIDTQTIIKQFKQLGIQTIHKYLQLDQERYIQTLVRDLAILSKKQIGMQKLKYQQIERLLINNINKSQRFGNKQVIKLQREKALSQKKLFEKEEQLNRSIQTVNYLLRQLQTIKNQHSQHILVKGQAVTDYTSHYLKTRANTFDIRLSNPNFSNEIVKAIKNINTNTKYKQRYNHNPFSSSKIPKKLMRQTISVFSRSNSLNASQNPAKPEVLYPEGENQQLKQVEEDSYLSGSRIGWNYFEKNITNYSNTQEQRNRKGYRKYSATKRIKTLHQKICTEL